jgi:hypothetical protein
MVLFNMFGGGARDDAADSIAQNGRGGGVQEMHALSNGESDADEESDDDADLAVRAQLPPPPAPKKKTAEERAVMRQVTEAANLNTTLSGTWARDTDPDVDRKAKIKAKALRVDSSDDESSDNYGVKAARSAPRSAPDPSKPFACPEPGCTQRYLRKGGLTKHVRTAHPHVELALDIAATRAKLAELAARQAELQRTLDEQEAELADMLRKSKQ